MPDFDPTTVPPFPVVTLDLRDDSSVTVDGRLIDIGMDQPPTEAGIAAVASVARDHGVNAVRVRATSPDGTHLMVITADGTPYDITPPKQTAGKKGDTGKGIAVGISACLAIVLVAGGTIGVIAATRPAVAPTTMAVPTPPGYLANLPVLAPPGYGQKAEWAINVQGRVDPVLLSGGRIALVDEEGDLAVVDGATGATTWRGAGGPSGQTGINLTTVEDRAVIAAATSSKLTLWPLDTIDSVRVAGTTVEIGASGEVSYLGSAPLITLSDQTVALLTTEGVERLDVPVTGTPILATQDSVVVANEQSWWAITSGAEPVRSELPTPAAIDQAPTLISAADDSHLIVVWPSSVSGIEVATLIDLERNAIVAQANVPSGTVRNDSEPIHSADGGTLTIGQLYINYGNTPAIIALDDLTPSVIDGDTVYGLEDRKPVVATLADGAFTSTPFTSIDTDDVALPVAITEDYAYVVAEKVGETFIYALPRTQGGNR